MIKEGEINGRLFKITDRVKAYFEGKWWTGTAHSFRPAKRRGPKSIHDLAVQCGHITEIIEPENDYGFVTYLNYSEPFIQIRTDEKVSEEEQSLFDGYGISFGKYSSSIIFEHEEEFEPFKIVVINNLNDIDEMPGLFS